MNSRTFHIRIKEWFPPSDEVAAIMAQLCVLSEDLYLEMQGLNEDEITPLDADLPPRKLHHGLRSSTVLSWVQRRRPMTRKRHIRRANHCGAERRPRQGQCPGPVPEARHLGCHLLYVADEICGAGSQRREETTPTGKRKPASETDGGGASAGPPGAESDHRKKLVRPKAKRAAAQGVVARFGLSQRRVCRFVSLDRNTLRYRSRRRDDRGLRTRVREIARPNGAMGAPGSLCGCGGKGGE
jgi:hypothetical protein